LLDGAMARLAAGLAELRELARGIHPAVLSERGRCRRWTATDTNAFAGSRPPGAR
jgi:hypothetical protein